MVEAAGQPVYRRLGLVLGAAVTSSFALPAGSLLPPLVLCVAAGVVLSAPVWSGGPPATLAMALTLVAIVYVGWLAGHVLWLHRRPDGDDLVLFLVGVTWVGESAAWAVGSTVGRRKLAPVVSPRKTVEGALAQWVASILAAVAAGAWLVPAWPGTWAAAAGALLGGMGQVGDLAESVLKRWAGVKDTGGLIPGHGGVLDRIDGLLFNAPTLYYLVTFATPAVRA
jgi:phosphatidate cytidylyltransferase